MSFNFNLFILSFLFLCLLHVGSGKIPSFPAHSLSSGCNSNLELLSETMELFLSTDSGLSWTHSNLPANRSFMSYFANCRSGPFVSVIASHGHEIFQTKNNGNDWEQLPAPNEIWVSIAANDESSHIFAIAARQGIYMSADGGQTWTLTIGTESQAWKKVVCDRLGELSVSISVTGELVLSKDYGKKYTVVSFFQANPKAWMDIAMNKNGDVVILADLNKVYRSLNRGVAWKELSIIDDEHEAISIQWRSVFCSHLGSIVAAISVDSKLYISIDYGNTWSVASDVEGERWLTMTSDADGVFLYASTEKALYASNDYGKTWKNVVSKNSVRSINAIAKQAARMDESLFAFNNIGELGASIQPSMEPTSTAITLSPTRIPSYEPSHMPSTLQPTTVPTLAPTISTTFSPSIAPSIIPSTSPSIAPSMSPTVYQTTGPTLFPSRSPTIKPTRRPTVQQTTSSPTQALVTSYPTLAPTAQVYPIFKMETYLSIGNVYGTILTPAAIDALLTTLSMVLKVSKEYLYYLGIRSVSPAITQRNLRSTDWATAGTNISYSLVAVTRVEIPLVIYADSRPNQVSSQNFTKEIFRNLSTVLTSSIATNEFVSILQLQAQITNATDFDYVEIQKVNFTSVTLLPPTSPPAFGSHRHDNSFASNIGGIVGVVIGCLVVIVAVLYYYRKKIRKIWRKRIKQHARVMTLDELGIQRYDPVDFYAIQLSPSKDFAAADKFEFEDVYSTEQRPKKSKSMTKKLQKMAQEERNLDKIPSTFEAIKNKPQGKASKYLADPLSSSAIPPPSALNMVEHNELTLGLDEPITVANNRRSLILDVNQEEDDPFESNLPQSPLSASLKKSTALANPKADPIDIVL